MVILYFFLGSVFLIMELNIKLIITINFFKLLNKIIIIPLNSTSKQMCG